VFASTSLTEPLQDPMFELHKPILSAMRLETALDLAKKQDLTVPVEAPQKLYEYDTLVEFLTSHTFVCEKGP
jgi:hypothetical protein